MAMSGMSRTLALRSAEAPTAAFSFSFLEDEEPRFSGGVGGGTGSTALIVVFQCRANANNLVILSEAKNPSSI
jgi:hypothetical protein